MLFVFKFEICEFEKFCGFIFPSFMHPASNQIVSKHCIVCGPSIVWQKSGNTKRKAKTLIAIWQIFDQNFVNYDFTVISPSPKQASCASLS